MPTRRRKALDFCKKWGKRLALAGMLFHGATQLNYFRNDIYNAVNPSPVRREFQEEYGFPIRGWKADIEEQPQDLKDIAETVCRERQTRDFKLNNIRVESANYLKRDIIEQAITIVATGQYSGWCYLDRLGLKRKAGEGTVSHEIKHQKIYEVIRVHPEFLEKWDALSRDEDGKSLYRGYIATYGEDIRFIGKLFRDNRGLDYEKLGFVSLYAMSNIGEDIAETCERAEINPHDLESVLFGIKPNPHNDRIPRNEKIVAKIKLAEEYKLIPEGFMEFHELYTTYQEAYASVENTSETKLAEEYLEKTKAFLNKHPNSVYECELRRKRGELLETKTVALACLSNHELDEKHKLRRNSIQATLEELDKIQKEETSLFRTRKHDCRTYLGIAISEYERALSAGFKDRFDYLTVLTDLKRCYEMMGDDKTAELYDDAIIEYGNRYNNSDVKLASRGVNDFLEIRGISLDRHEQRKLESISGGKR